MTAPPIPGSQIFRDFNTDGVPSSLKYEPEKSKIRGWLGWAETAILGLAGLNENQLRFDAPQSLSGAQKTQARANLGFGTAANADVGTALGNVPDVGYVQTLFASASVGGALSYTTLAQLTADTTDRAQYQLAYVSGDTEANNGTYQNTSATSTNTWVRTGPLPGRVPNAMFLLGQTNASGDAIEAVPLADTVQTYSASHLYIVRVGQVNTVDAPTFKIGALAAWPILNEDGSNPGAGRWLAFEHLILRAQVSTSQFVIVSPQPRSLREPQVVFLTQTNTDGAAMLAGAVTPNVTKIQPGVLYVMQMYAQNTSGSPSINFGFGTYNLYDKEAGLLPTPAWRYLDYVMFTFSTSFGGIFKMVSPPLVNNYATAAQLDAVGIGMAAIEARLAALGG